jgi:hypothetical protein
MSPTTQKFFLPNLLTALSECDSVVVHMGRWNNAIVGTMEFVF